MDSQLFIIVGAAICAAVSGAPESPQTSCYSCLYYANVQIPMNNRKCTSGESIATVQCPEGLACKVTFLQDSNGSVVHAFRGCEPADVFSKKSKDTKLSVTLNARTTMYCRLPGCNNNWLGHASPEASVNGQGQGQQQQQQLRCWVGFGRHIDQFKLQTCSEKILRMSQGNSSDRRPVCLLAQLARQIEYNGRQYESAIYMGDCAPHAVSVYGQNYPMFEYERVCPTTGCNSGRPLPRLGVGLVRHTAAAAKSGPAAPRARLASIVALLLVRMFA